MEEKLFIGIAGIIGAGKTTLTTALAKVMGLAAYYEPVADNEYLDDFYRDMRRHAFAMQVYLLNARFQQHQSIVWQGKGGVQDRTIYEDSVFAKMLMEAGLMDERDYRTYASLFAHMANFMRKPNLIVFLDVSPERSFERIRRRNRDCEAGITLDYLRLLHAAYASFIESISRVIPVIRVDWDNFRTPEEMAEKIHSEYRSMRNVRSVT